MRWELRNADGCKVSCDQAGIAYVNVVIAASSQNICGTLPSENGVSPCQFRCEEGEGVAPFVIPEGNYFISLQATNAQGTPLTSADGVIAPAPISRTIATGQVTDLSSNLILVDRENTIQVQCE